jgi:hypothetical protein
MPVMPLLAEEKTLFEGTSNGARVYLVSNEIPPSPRAMRQILRVDF